jgi:hypothetical protein
MLAVATQFPLVACSIPERLFAVPQPLTTKAEISELSSVRYWIREDPEPLIREAMDSFDKEQRYLAQSGHTGPLPPVNFLAISGGGDNGAFGAGLLVGWTTAGDRPEFKLVTGVSTGALIAPLAFLGPDYDEELSASLNGVGEVKLFLSVRSPARIVRGSRASHRSRRHEKG